MSVTRTGIYRGSTTYIGVEVTPEGRTTVTWIAFRIKGDAKLQSVPLELYSSAVLANEDEAMAAGERQVHFAIDKVLRSQP
jgi:hypothetical protein